ncbi:MAG: hypothetical protein ACYC4R_02135 [Anaerolineae bacterium]
MTTPPRFCAYCGKPLGGEGRFCGQCGRTQPAAAPQAPVSAPAPAAPVYYSAPPPPPAPTYAPPPAMMAAPVESEPILGIVPGVQRKSGFMGLKVDSYNVVLTPYRLVFAYMSSELMKEAVNTAREQAKSEGKGWLAQVGAQMRWLNVVCARYQQMPVGALFTQYPGSFAVNYAEIKRVRLREEGGDEDAQSVSKMIVETMGGKYDYTLTGMSIRDAKRVLQATLGDRVR